MWVEILYGGKYWKPLWIAFIIDCVDVILRATQDKHYHFTQARTVLERDLSFRAEHIAWGRLLEKSTRKCIEYYKPGDWKASNNINYLLVYFQLIK